MNELTSFRQFPSRTQAIQVKNLLIQNGIHASLSDDENGFEKIYFGSGTKHFHEVQIANRDFEKAEQILAAGIAEEVDSTDTDYYLFDYSDKELLEILEKYDEWSNFDYLLAQKILKQRGKEVDVKTLSSLKYKRLDILAQPESVGTSYLTVAYISAFSGGVLGIVFGYVIMNATKTLPDGNKVFSYTSKDRAHGKTVFYIGCIIASIAVIAGIMRGYIMSQ